MHHADTLIEAGLRLGTVFKKSQGEYGVESGGETLACEISNALRKQLIYHTAAGCTHPATDPEGCPRCRPSGSHRSVVEVHDIRELDPIAVGDLVRFVVAGDRGLITEVLPRRNTLVRRAAGKKRLKQVVAANVDQVVAVVAAPQPHPAWDLLDRYLAAAEESNIPAAIVITKSDLVDADAFGDILDNYRRINYQVLLTSTVTGDGLTEMRALLAGRVSLFAGKSGVGKTTLLNTIQPGLGLRVGDVSRSGPQAGKGRHTTSHVEMVGLDFGGAIVDTPGMREFGLWDVFSDRQRNEHEDVDLAHHFREMRPYLGLCRFGLDCGHTHEPHCAIKSAVDAGEISSRRYHTYVLLSGRR
jgi:ribosome biogenesis GTPase / thiamine phosphate phosphatase